MEDWITASGGDPVALLRVLDTFVNTRPRSSPGSRCRPWS